MKLTLNFSLKVEVECPLKEDDFAAVVSYVLGEEGVTRPCFVSLTLVGNDEMRALNREWRGQDVPTDVLSLECERPDDPDLALDEPCELGDIVLAPEFVRAQAASFGTTWADELRLLTVHATLHLLGYDHLEEEEARVMEAREDELLADLLTDAPVGHVDVTRHEGEDA